MLEEFYSLVCGVTGTAMYGLQPAWRSVLLSAGTTNRSRGFAAYIYYIKHNNVYIQSE